MRLVSLIKKNHLLHFIATYLRDKKFRKDYNRYLKKNPYKKSRKIILHELKLLRDYWGCPPYHYYLYNLYEKKLSDNQLLDYISPFYYYEIYWKNRHTGLNQTLYWSKYFQYQLLKRLNIPTMDLVAVIRSRVLLDMNNDIITVEELIEKYLKTTNSAIFFKPDYGRGGKGIFMLSKKDDVLFLNNEPTTIENILKTLLAGDDYVVQELFVQSRKMAQIYKHSVNTLRIGTQVNKNEVTISFCMLRMGTENSFVDNMSAGGIVIPVDINDGTFTDYAQSPDAKRKYDKHPNSNFVFKGERIENWQRIKSLIIKYAYLLGECKDLGWDVAIGETGIKILEINIYFALDQQPVYHGMRKILGIYPEIIENNIQK